MNFQQLRIVRETVRRNFNLTEVANALFTSQSGVSKHIKDLEDELGVELFVRRGKRLLGLTDPGKELVEIVERILVDTANIKRLGEQFSNREQGQLVIATTHTQARYVLPHVVAAFRKAYPEGAPDAAPGQPDRDRLHAQRRRGRHRHLHRDAARCAVRWPPFRSTAGITASSCRRAMRWRSAKPLTLEAIAEWPIITYHEGFTGRGNIDQTFANAGLAPDIVMSAMDTDVLKAYVELGLGVGIIAAMAFDPKRDAGLQLIDAAHLFEANTSLIAVRRAATCATTPTASSSCARRRCPKQVVRAAVLADQGKGEAAARRARRSAFAVERETPSAATRSSAPADRAAGRGRPAAGASARPRSAAARRGRCVPIVPVSSTRAVAPLSSTRSTLARDALARRLPIDDDVELVRAGEGDHVLAVREHRLRPAAPHPRRRAGCGPRCGRQSG